MPMPILILVLLLWPWLGFAANLHSEKEYQDSWCSQHGGEIEHVLPDNIRIDCLTEKYAIEFDFGKKWAESFGQAEFYALTKDRRPGIVIILETNADYRGLERLLAILSTSKKPPRVWVIRPKDIE